MIAVLTDFGLLDPYVGIMKGVIYGIDPAAQIVDLTHAVARHDVREGAFMLANSVGYFPQGTVFLSVVDPGVGGARRPIAAEAGGYQFVGPDNGLLSYALAVLGGGRVVELTEPEFRLPQVSYSFHGRDIFAPAAAWLALGTPLDAMGPAVADMVSLPFPTRIREGKTVRGEIVHIDGFGNIESSVGPLRWRDGATVELGFLTDGEPDQSFDAASVRVMLPWAAQPMLIGLRHAYSEVEPGMLLAMISSASFLEISRNGASAAELTGARIGDPVELSWE